MHSTGIYLADVVQDKQDEIGLYYFIIIPTFTYCKDLPRNLFVADLLYIFTHLYISTFFRGFLLLSQFLLFLLAIISIFGYIHTYPKQALIPLHLCIRGIFYICEYKQICKPEGCHRCRNEKELPVLSLLLTFSTTVTMHNYPDTRTPGGCSFQWSCLSNSSQTHFSSRLRSWNTHIIIMKCFEKRTSGQRSSEASALGFASE